MNDKKFIMTSSDRKNSKVKDILPLIIIVSITLTIGGILFAAKLTPEQTITSFNPMTETSLKNDLRVIKIKILIFIFPFRKLFSCDLFFLL